MSIVHKKSLLMKWYCCLCETMLSNLTFMYTECGYSIRIVFNLFIVFPFFFVLLLLLIEAKHLGATKFQFSTTRIRTFWRLWPVICAALMRVASYWIYEITAKEFLKMNGHIFALYIYLSLSLGLIQNEWKYTAYNLGYLFNVPRWHCIEWCK